MKKDLEYIAKLEKAIKQKYGEEAILNPKSNWDEEKEKEYLEQLKKIDLAKRSNEEETQKVEIDGFLVSKKLINRDSNRNCPVCEKYSFSIQDDIYMLKYDCCEKCFIQYIEGREKRWLNGWRPGENKCHK
tara:strand:+ start:6392 stop:6784 length:393 start_codon:yes stop_codon:yes gene_type:complete